MSTNSTNMQAKPYINKKYEGKLLTISLGGSWLSSHSDEIDKDTFIRETRKVPCDRVIIDATHLVDWDITFLSFIVSMIQIARKHKVTYEFNNLPEKAEKLVLLALEIKPKPRRRLLHLPRGFFEKIGMMSIATAPLILNVWNFTTSLASAFVRLWSGKSTMNKKDLYQCLQECGINALPIIALTSTLMGIILAFTGSIQFALVGAEIYTAPFVSISMLRIMGALITGIILSGRTGASFAALLGTMQVNEEIDALETFGISPYDFLVMPRVIALTLMTPFLTLYADFMGIIGGFAIGIFLLELSPVLYFENTLLYLTSSYLWVGLFHGLVFGAIIAVVGCYQGMRCGRSAESVGKVTTAAVVNSLVGIIIMTAILTFIFSAFGL